jgi:predicted Zn finger-like uncharacterized protein
MSLITRCPACGTMFKVVADQLKISQGWVRCGHCAEVFDAATHLQPRAFQGAADAIGGADMPLPTDILDAALVAQPDAFSAVPQAPAPGEAPTQGEGPVAPVSRPEIQVSLPPDLAVDVFASSASPEPLVFSVPAQQAPQRDSSFGESEGPEHESVQDVSFVRDARRNAFWRRSAVRWSLGLAALVLSAVLLLQATLFQRNTLAAWQPWLSRGLQTLCKQLDCEINPPQLIESVVIDSSSFNKIGTDTYRLKVMIKNAGAMALAMPSLELTLTDTQDQALLRRVLTPGELGATSDTLAAGAEFSGVVAIEISTPGPGAAGASAPQPSGPLRIAGYRVLAFYP